MLWPTKLAGVTLLHADLCLMLILDGIAFTMTPPGTGHADDHEFPIFIAFLAKWALL